jgi:hypothetical protein
MGHIMKGVLSSTLAAACVTGVLTLYPMPGPAGWLVMIGVAGVFGITARRRRARCPA